MVLKFKLYEETEIPSILDSMLRLLARWGGDFLVS